MLNDLKMELAPFPGRLDAVWRYLISSALVITLSLSLQIPFLAISLIIVFFAAQENTVMTRLFSKALVLGATLGVGVSIVLLQCTMDRPLLRILGACVIGFCGMYFMRISRLGSIGFLTAQLVLYAQSLVDLTSSAEGLLRSLLWFWMASVYPAVVTIVVNEFFRPPHASRLLREEAVRQLEVVLSQLDARLTDRTAQPLRPGQMENASLALHRHLAYACMEDRAAARERGRYLLQVTSIDRLHACAFQLSRLPQGSMNTVDHSLCQALSTACRQLRQCVHDNRPYDGPAPALGPQDGQSTAHSDLRPILMEMAQAVRAYADASTDRTDPQDTQAPAADGGLAQDAFTNPRYGQFAFKTVTSALVCYAFYSALAWPGIHTAMLTCIIMALPSLGATSHKGLMRIVGCAIGTVLGLLATVYVLPHIDGLMGLLAMSLPVIALSAWIAAGSPRLNYLGIQIQFAFALGMFGHFGPNYDLTEFRDRMVGILVGVAASLLVFTFLWPEREGAQLRQQIARLVRLLGRKLDLALLDFSQATLALPQARLECLNLLRQNRELHARVELEPGLQYEHGSVSLALSKGLSQLQEFMVMQQQLVLQLAPRRSSLTSAQTQAVDECIADCRSGLESLARLVESQDHRPAAPARGLEDCASHISRARTACRALPLMHVPEPIVSSIQALLAGLDALVNTCAEGATLRG